MDTSDSKWFGELTISGQAKPIEMRGSIKSLFAQTLVTLSKQNPRELKDGKHIGLRFSDRPFDSKSPSLAQKVAEVIAGLDIDPNQHDGPFPHENYQQFHDRILAETGNPSTAQWFANDWFDLPQETQSVLWMNDAKAQRFTHLNASNKAFESALPNEYEMLKQHVQLNYPEHAAKLTFRTA